MEWEELMKLRQQAKAARFREIRCPDCRGTKRHLYEDMNAGPSGIGVDDRCGGCVGLGLVWVLPGDPRDWFDVDDLCAELS